MSVFVADPFSQLPPAELSALSEIRIFRELPPHVLRTLEGKVVRLRAESDETLVDLFTSTEPFRRFFFIHQGQIKIVGYDEEARLKPLNFLRKGEFFLDKAVQWGAQVATKAVAITAVELLVVSRQTLKTLADEHPPFQSKLKELTERVDYRNRLYSEDKYARSVLEFLIDNALTQASRVKITQLDKCIECNTCYTSCEERHGFQRLERGYARFGVLDIAKSCLTCFYPTCIPACPVDSVVYNAEKGEVDILDDCIGCSACARACQYGAIRMHKADPSDPHLARFFAPDKKIKPKFVADKCSHCSGHSDMVCITSCPTGAIIEVEAVDLLENPKIFGAREEGWNALPSILQQGLVERFLQMIYLSIGVILTLWLSWEAYALARIPKLSSLIAFQENGWIPQGFELKFERGSDFCYLLGNIGFSLVIVALLYPLRKAFPGLFKYLGRKPLWLDLHNFCGLLATLFVTFHTGFDLPLQPATAGYLALLGVTFSGLFGRFLYQMIPRGVAGTELKMQQITEENATLTKKIDALLGHAPDQLEVTNRILTVMTEDAEKRPTFWGLVWTILRGRFLLWKLRWRFPKEIRINRRQVRVFLDLLRQKMRFQRNVTFLAVSSRLFARWQYIHRPFVYVMATITLGHIVFNLIYFGGHH